MSPPRNISAPIPHIRTNSQYAKVNLRQNPSLFLASWLYARRPIIAQCSTSNSVAVNDIHGSSSRHATPVTVVCVSDTHTETSSVPPGDILLHAGDLTSKGTFLELQAQLDWLNTLPHSHKIVIGGNHDLLLDDSFVSSFPERIFPVEGQGRKDLRWGSIVYLQESSATITVRGRKLEVFGSPVTPFCGNWAFQYPPIRDVWHDKIPEGTDIVVTHGPPKGHLDSDGKGCEWLNRELWRKKPRLVVFGHIHGARGRKAVCWDYIQRVYDGVEVGDSGLPSVLCMAVVLGVKKFWALVGGSSGVEITTFINV